MTDDTEAKTLYEGSTNGSAPRWELLGDITKGVWREAIEKHGSAEAALRYLYLNQPKKPDDHEDPQAAVR